MDHQGYAPMTREEIEACHALATKRSAYLLWTNDHGPHGMSTPAVENLVFKGVRVTFQCTCGSACEVWI
jgi:hypothetical protein